ncbi:MAG TPA: amino acid adenylation domain-containing protein [Longimicrobiales bacterium]|nr:amino acid adenylation domain-containing protein [Longimicrobiales bacterium]
MTATRTLHGLLQRSASVSPQAPAVEDPAHDASATYAELSALVAEVRDALTRLGVSRGDRVGLCTPKSIGSVASIFGILECGAAYVPVDASAPVERNAYVFSDCAVRAVIVSRPIVAALEAAVGRTLPVVTELHGTHAYGGDLVVVDYGSGAQAGTAPEYDGELAYILYTSGSTGRPKGVVHTHASALSFVDWCSQVLQPTHHDRFSSHAPFHFDLSILDIYVPLEHGGTLVLIGEELGKQPQVLAPVIAQRRITVWYSTPTILRLLAEYGRMQEHDYSALRLVLFAGEVFPVKHLRALQALWTAPEYYNLYGPTETNVCTYYAVPNPLPAGQTEPCPIGVVCENDRARVVDEHGHDVPKGNEGELCIAGGTVMQAYWNLPERTAQGFHVDSAGERWYRTGDIVREQADGIFIFLGRRDRMVKRRGYRVELGEIEAALYRHPAVAEAAAVAVRDADGGVLIRAYITGREPDAAPSTIELKRFCAGHLPLYMVPDQFSIHASLPKTSTDKVDYQTLLGLA